MGTLAEWAGRSLEITSATSITLGSRVRLYRVEMSASGQDVSLPDATHYLSLGGPAVVVWNTGSNAYDLLDAAGGDLGISLAQDEVASCFLVAKDDAAGEWVVRVTPTDTIPDPPENDFLFTLGGFESAIQKEAWQYVHGTDSWSQQTDSTRHHISAPGGVSGGLAYVAGSSAGGGQTGVEHDEYAPDTWTALTDVPNRSDERSGAPDGGVLEVYGRVFSPATQHDRYTISGDSWASGTAFPTDHRYGVAERGSSGLIYVFGGNENFIAAWQGVQSNREHDTGADSFSSLTGLPTDQRARLGGFVLGGKVYAVCGTVDNNGPDLDRVDEYDPGGDSWASRTAYPAGTTQQGPGAAARSVGIGYAVGGLGNIECHSYVVDTWTARADHGAGGTNLRGFANSTLTPTV